LQWNSLIPGTDYVAVATEVTKTLKKEAELKKISLECELSKKELWAKKTLTQLRLNGETMNFYTENWDEHQNLWEPSELSDGTQCSAKEKSTETMAIQNTRMLFFVL
jgi:hypothetical protein